MIIDTVNKLSYKEIQISESELQNLIIENFDTVFPEYKLVDREHTIQGDVRQFGMSGRIDILAYDTIEEELIIIELKKNHTKNILIQALDYSDFIEENLEIIASRLKRLSIKERRKLIKKNKAPKIILIAKNFLHPTIRRAKKLSAKISLYNYNVFSKGLVRIERINKISDSTLQPNKNNIVNNDLNNNNIIPLVREVIELGVIEEKYYLIEDMMLKINPTRLYNAYKNHLINSGLIPISKTNFINGIKSSKEYVNYYKSINFKKNCTSAILIKLT